MLKPFTSTWWVLGLSALVLLVAMLWGAAWLRKVNRRNAEWDAGIDAAVKRAEEKP